MNKSHLYELRMGEKKYLAWNRDIVFWNLGFLDSFEVEEIAPWHLRLMRNRDGARMDYFPKTGRACWLGFTKQTFFTIRDMDAYINLKFK